MKSELAFDAATPRQFPDDRLPEVAIMGRSNVGKSSLVNALLGRRKLARTSGRPGKTRRIHFYRVESACYLVDLPGYGYAAVSKRERGSWRPMVESYLRRDREPLQGAILLVDVRRGLEVEERDLLDWLAAERIPVAVALTKSDKLKPGAANSRLLALREEAGVERAALVSATSRKGLPELANWIETWTGTRLKNAEGIPL